ncbi:MAG: glycoside hydrolase, partial [Bacteroidales bacterium]
MENIKKNGKRFCSGQYCLSETGYALFKKILIPFVPFVFLLLVSADTLGQKLQLNDLGYFETPGVNVFVYSNQYTGMFNDEKNAGIEIIHHGVRTATGGAVRLQNTPEQWDLVPAVVDRKID